MIRKKVVQSFRSFVILNKAPITVSTAPIRNRTRICEFFIRCKLGFKDIEKNYRTTVEALPDYLDQIVL